jgi:glycosyltransferase involved in cell wall biosynthesis
VAEPVVSLILCVKNGMPCLPEAVASVAAQTYSSFELVVQDAESTDGSLEFLRGVDGVPGVRIVSEPDGGIGDGYNRAVCRCRGEIVGSIDSDNLLAPYALERAVAFMSERPELAAAYGGSNMIAAAGEPLYPWMPGQFDLLRFLTCELVPPFATSFFSRAVCGEELRFDARLTTCADFDMWLRISHLPISRIPQVLGSTRLSGASMTRRAITYDQYIADKSAALERYLARYEESPLLHAVRARSLAGIRLWAAESVYDIEGWRTAQFERYLEAAEEFDSTSAWAERVRAKPEIDPPQDSAPEPESEPDDPPRSVRSRATSALRRLKA